MSRVPTSVCTKVKCQNCGTFMYSKVYRETGRNYLLFRCGSCGTIERKDINTKIGKVV